jgi:hypothetical protein
LPDRHGSSLWQRRFRGIYGPSVRPHRSRH